MTRAPSHYGTCAWPLGDQDGYSIGLCECYDGPYLGARKMGTPCCCERCGYMTRDQWDHIVNGLK